MGINVDLEQALSNPASEPQSTPEVDVKQEAHSGDAPGENLTDIEKLERFRFEGRDWEPKELKRALLRNEDYTRKTQELSQERKQFEHSRGEFDWYRQNFEKDLPKVLENPALFEELKKHYPEQFHKLAEVALSRLPQHGTPPANELEKQVKELLSWRGEIQSEIQKANEAKADAMLDTWYAELSKKYAEADSEVVTNRAFLLAEKLQGQRPPVEFSKEHLERIFKADHESREKRYSEKYRSKVEEQKKTSSRGKDTGAGGGIPGSAPVKAKTIKEATKEALARIEAGQPL